MAFNYAHHSGRFDRTPKSLIEGFTNDVTKHHADIVAFTEIASEVRARHLRKAAHRIKWGFYRADGFGLDECGFTWDTEKFELVHASAKILTEIDTYATTGRRRAPFGATFIVLREIATDDLYLFGTAHTPSHVSHGGRWYDNNRARQHRAGCKEINRELKRLKKKYKIKFVILSMDVNLNIVARWVKTYLRLTFPWLRILIDNNPEGTHGKHRVIDVILVSRRLRKRGRVDAYKAPDSDHKTIIARIIKRIKKK